MTFNSGAAILDTVVLAVVASDPQGTYGYKITKDVQQVLDVSESSLYPVLRRLQTDGYLETYDQEYNGRNRRYYKVTSNGMIRLDSFRKDWLQYNHKINSILFGKENP